MLQAEAGPGVVAVGFWLPVDRPNFFDPGRDTNSSIASSNSDTEPYTSFTATTRPSSIPPTRG